MAMSRAAVVEGKKPISQLTLIGSATISVLSDAEDIKALALRRPAIKFPIAQEAVVRQNEGEYFFTQDFSGFRNILEALSYGALQEELEKACDIMLGEKELHPYFEQLGLQQFVELYLNRDEITHADRLAALEKNKIGLLETAGKQLESKLRLHLSYAENSKDSWSKFLTIMRKSRGKSLENFLVEEVGEVDRTKANALYSTVEVIINRYKGLLPFASARFKEELNRNIQVHACALNYISMIRDTLKEDYPYFELADFVDAQKTIGISPEHAKQFLKGYESAMHSLREGTIAVLDHIILTPTELRVGGSMPAKNGRQMYVYVSILHDNLPFVNRLLALYGVNNLISSNNSKV